MNDPTPEPPRAQRSRWVAVIAVMALIGGIAVAASQWSKPASGPDSAPVPEPMPAAAPSAPESAGALPEGHPPIAGTAASPAPAVSPPSKPGKLPAGHPPIDGATAPPTSGKLPAGHPSLAGAPSGADPGYVSIEGMHELMQAGLAPTNRKVWVDEVENADVSRLTDHQRELFLRYANSEDCICGYTLASCRAFNPTCPGSPPRVSALLDSIRSGRIQSATGLRARPKSDKPPGHPGAD
jgi:hypothetical protein